MRIIALSMFLAVLCSLRPVLAVDSVSGFADKLGAVTLAEVPGVVATAVHQARPGELDRILEVALNFVAKKSPAAIIPVVAEVSVMDPGAARTLARKATETFPILGQQIGQALRKAPAGGTTGFVAKSKPTLANGTDHEKGKKSGDGDSDDNDPDHDHDHDHDHGRHNYGSP